MKMNEKESSDAIGSLGSAVGHAVQIKQKLTRKESLTELIPGFQRLHSLEIHQIQ